MTEKENLIEDTYEQIYYDAEKALESFNEILELEPYNISVINGKGSALMKLKQTTEAEKCFNKSMMIEENTPALINLGIIYKNRGEYEKALNNFDKAILIKPELSDMITLFKKEVFDEIELDDINITFENFNETANDFIKEGIINEKHGKYWDALDSYENASNEDSLCTDAMNSLTKKLNVHFQNELIYEDIESRNIRNNFIKRKIAEIIINEQRPRKATRLVDKALSENPDDLIFLNFKGGIEFCSENYTESIVYFDKCIDLDSKYYYAIFNKSIALRRLKRYKEALESLNCLVEIPEAYNHIKYHRSALLKKVRSDSSSK